MPLKIKGTDIVVVGTKEALNGTAMAASIDPKDGTICWVGETEVWWDDQKTVLSAQGNPIWVDERGVEYHDVIVVDDVGNETKLVGPREAATEQFEVIDAMLDELAARVGALLADTAENAPILGSLTHGELHALRVIEKNIAGAVLAMAARGAS